MASDAFLLSRLLLRFDNPSHALKGNISAIALAPDGGLWMGSDELTSLERLLPVEPNVYGKHQSFHVNDYIDLPNTKDEIDIEGMDYSHGYLWFTGSHSTKRKKPKGNKEAKDLKRLATIESEVNRYVIGRIPLLEGNLHRSCSLPGNPEQLAQSACLQLTETGNVLMDALVEDEHLGAFVTNQLPSKENGLDIEGLAVCKDTLFLGLRGPVLRGWAIILEIKVKQKGNELLLTTFEETKLPYKKHFVNLDGLGIRELCLQGDDLLILGGPTMDLTGTLRIYRLRHAMGRDNNSVTDQCEDGLEVMFDIPFNPNADKAEGLTLIPSTGYPSALLVVYDEPDPRRMKDAQSMLVDIFRI